MLSLTSSCPSPYDHHELETDAHYEAPSCLKRNPSGKQNQSANQSIITHNQSTIDRYDQINPCLFTHFIIVLR